MTEKMGGGRSVSTTESSYESWAPPGYSLESLKGAGNKKLRVTEIMADFFLFHKILGGRQLSDARGAKPCGVLVFRARWECC